jgi:glycosyltransferase involved in cell wall biosynthesis
MITGHDILCLSSQDWGDLWTRKQRFMQRFARQGNRVLYVETQLSLASVGLVKADPARAVRWLAGPRLVEPNLHVATLPLVLPGFQMSLAVNAVNNAGLAPLLRRWTRGLGFQRPVLWTYNPYSESLVGRLAPRVAVYECVDELAASRGLVRRDVVQALERRLLDQVGLVIVTHENLAGPRRAPGRDVHVIPNGAELEHFRAAAEAGTPIPAEMRAIPRPVIGFLGSIQYWLDFDLLRSLALARPEWSFVLIGPTGRLAAVHKIALLPNVHLLGRKPYAALPSYLKAFDVCLNPYLQDETARHCSPLKLYEYLAAGKPVVSVDMPEARKFGGVVAIGRTYQEILSRLAEIVARPDDPRQVAARITAVAAHSWDHRFRDLERVLGPHLDPAATPAAVSTRP